MPLRIRLLLSATAMLAMVWLLFAIADRALALVQRFLALPWIMQSVIGLVLILFLLSGLVFLWWLLKPRRQRRRHVPDRTQIEQRIQQLRAHDIDTSLLDAELADLDRRKVEERLYLALFGEISTGKSSLIRAMAPHATPYSDVRGGTTRGVQHIDTLLGEYDVTLADVPGSREVDGEVFEQMARQEALRAHAVVYLCAGDLARTQMEELRWLAEFGKPLLLALNKADQWSDLEREQLCERLRERSKGMADAVVAISAGGSERFERTLANGQTERVERQRQPAIAALTAALLKMIAAGARGLESAREQAVLAGLHESTGALEQTSRDAQASRIVTRYARRAVVGAMAAIAPGSDLVIQGVLAAGMTRELAKLYGIGVTDVQIEDFIHQARLTLRTGSSLVLAIAGNALKAFPGLGTLGGGVMHAFAYALIFDSMGRALATSLAERQSLDLDDASTRLKDLLGQAHAGRLRQLATLTTDAWRERAQLNESSDADTRG
ncbi:GTPase [Dyella sp.]|uniref:GTPase n=1 Tax=Dyella sp. TaxID=1869338 RepID=UPI002ED2F215